MSNFKSKSKIQNKEKLLSKNINTIIDIEKTHIKKLFNKNYSVTKSYIEDKKEPFLNRYKESKNIELLLQEEYKKSFYLVNKLLGKPYIEIQSELGNNLDGPSFYQNLFRRASIYEIYSYEICKYIYNTYKKLECDLIYFYNDVSGSIGRAFKNCDLFKEPNKNVIPPYKIFDENPDQVKFTFYDNVEKINISSKIKFTDDLNKRILLVITYSNLNMINSILKGIKVNKENYYGILFIGNVISNDSLPFNIEKLLLDINYNFVEYNNCFSVSYNDIYDNTLKKLKLKYLQRFNSSCSTLFINSNKIQWEKKNNIELYNKHKQLYTYNFIINYIIDYVYLIYSEYILWDLNLNYLSSICNIVSINARENYLNKDNKEYKKFPEEIIIEFYRALRLIKKSVNILLFIYSENKLYDQKEFNKTQTELLELKKFILPLISYKTDNYYKYNILDFIKIKTQQYNKIHDNYCIVCINPKKFYCKSCKITPYCSKTCQELDWKYLNHKKLCKNKPILKYLLKSEYEIQREQLQKSEISENQSQKTINMLNKSNQRQFKIQEKKLKKKKKP